MQDYLVSKTPLWRQPVLWAAGAAALLVVGGVGWIIYSAEELDEQLDRQTAVADGHERMADLEHAYSDSAAQDARRPASQGGGNSSPQPGAEGEANSATLPNDAEGETSTAPLDAESAQRAKPDLSRERPVLDAVPSQQPPPSQPAEPAVATPAADSPPPDSPMPSERQPAEAAPTEPPAAEAGAPRPPDWLRVNENGEPYEVTVADGTVLKLDTYGDSYQGYHALTPVDGVKEAEVVLDYERARLGSNRACSFFRLDVAGGKMYWIEIQ